MTFTDGKLHIVEESHLKLKKRWGFEKGFRCHLCNHSFKLGERFRFVFLNQIPSESAISCGNVLVCESCDGPEVFQRLREWCHERQSRFWGRDSLLPGMKFHPERIRALREAELGRALLGIFEAYAPSDDITLQSMTSFHRLATQYIARWLKFNRHAEERVCSVCANPTEHLCLGCNNLQKNFYVCHRPVCKEAHELAARCQPPTQEVTEKQDILLLGPEE